jgi:toxin ParE1/3/4
VPLKVILRPAAVDDLERLYDHIAVDDVGRALAFVERIRGRCQGIVDFPEAGRRRDDLQTGLRVVAFERRVVIAYAIDPPEIRILRIFYGGRDLDILLSDGMAEG